MSFYVSFSLFSLSFLSLFSAPPPQTRSPSYIAVSGLNKVVVETEQDDSNGGEGGEGGDANEGVADESHVHISYTVTLKKGVEPQSKSVDLVQMNLKILTSILEANLQGEQTPLVCCFR